MLQILETHKKHKKENVALAEDAKPNNQDELDDLIN